MSSQIFVYGTLQRASDQPMAVQLRQSARWLGPARLRARLYDLGAYPAAVQGEGTVHGELFELADSELLKRLDAYEGPDYRRCLSVIQTEVGPSLAWVYWFEAALEDARELIEGRFPIAKPS